MWTLAPWSGDLRRVERELLGTTTGDWAPALDVAETKDAMVVTADMPGADPKELLTLKGERENQTEDGTKEGRGAFLRSVRLPMAVEGSKVTATFKNGVLVVTLPKTPAAKGTMIPVKVE